MPALVFPAPGCTDGQKIVDPFVGFNILSSNGAAFVNLLRNSTDLSALSWIRGSSAGLTNANYDIIDLYINEPALIERSDLYVLSNGFGDNRVITGSTSSFLGQLVSVNSNTTYTASFFARRGTATGLTYGIYDYTNSSTIVPPTSYFSQTTSTFSRITFSFLTGTNTSQIIFYPIWNISSGSPGSVNLAAPQIQVGSTATAYDATKDISFAALGISSIEKEDYGITRLSTFSDPSKDFEPIIGINQNKVKWNVVNEYIFDQDILRFSSLPGNTRVEFIGDLASQPYKVGDSVTIAGSNPPYRQTFTVTSFTTSSITISTSTAIPRNGALIINPNPSVYPQSFEYLNLLNYQRGVTSITKPRENFYLSTISPNDRAVEYFIDRDLLDFRLPSTNGLMKSISVLRPVRDNRIYGKYNTVYPFVELDPRRRVTLINRLKSSAVSPLMVYNPLKLTVVNKVLEVSPTRRTGVVNNFTTATGFLGPTPAGSWPSGIYRFSNEYLNGVRIILEDISTPDGIRSIPQFENIYRLESFDDQGIYIGPTVGVVGTDNIKNFDTVNDYIYDYDFTATTYIFPFPGYLYFAPDQQDTAFKVRFPLGSFVRISNTFTGFEQVTMVLESNLNNILVSLDPEFPNTYVGGTTIQDASPFYYPKEKVALDKIQFQLPIENVETPRENLFYSEYKPSIPGRSIVYNIDRILGEDINLYQNANRLETFQDPSIPGDFRLLLAGQNSEIRYPIVSWYIEDRDILTKTFSSSTIKTVFFGPQESILFPSGSTIKITNPGVNYNRVFSVITGTNASVTFIDPDDFPIGNSFIEKTEFTVFSKQYVKPVTNPTNPRENLYYFELAPGYRNKTPFDGISLERNIQTGKLISVNQLKDISVRRESGKVNAAIQVKAVISSPITTSTYLANLTTFTSQTSVRITGRPITPRERLYYFNLAPGYQNNGTYSYGRTFETPGRPLSSETLGKLRSAIVVKSDTSRFIAERLRLVSPLRGDSVVPLFPQLINPIKFRADTVQLFFTPATNTIQKQIARLIKGDVTLPPEFLQKPIVSLKSDLSLLNFGKTRFISPLISDRIVFEPSSINKPILRIADSTALVLQGLIEPIKFRSDTNQVFDTPRLSKLSSAAVLRDIGIRLDRGDLKFSIPIKGEKFNFYSPEFLQKQIAKLVKGDVTLSPEFVEPIKFRFDTNQVFDTPITGKITAPIIARGDLILFRNESLTKQLLVIKGITETIRPEFLNKQLQIIRSTGDNLSVAKVARVAHNLKADPQRVQFGDIFKFKFSFIYSQVFFAPDSSKLTTSAKVVADRSIIRVDKLSASTVIKSSFEKLDTGITDNYFDQRNYSVITAPNSPASWYRYSLIAPGFRSNLTYTQGRAVSDDAPKIEISKLTNFDNEGIVTDPILSITATTDPIVSITGRTDDFTNDVVLYYIEDRNILTLLPIGSPTITLYFQEMAWAPNLFSNGDSIRIINPNNNFGLDTTVLSATPTSVTILRPQTFASISGMTVMKLNTGYNVTVYFNERPSLPYAVNSYVKITNNNIASSIVVPVIASGLNFVTYVKPTSDFYLDRIPNATIANASPTVFPRLSVTTTVAPTRPRENLYYAELSRGYRYGILNTPFGSSLADEKSRILTNFLERDSIKIRDPLSKFLQGILEKDSLKLRAPFERFPFVDLLQRFRIPAENIAEVSLVTDGLIIKLITGDYRKGSTGIVDVAAPKKEPIQFWN